MVHSMMRLFLTSAILVILGAHHPPSCITHASCTPISVTPLVRGAVVNKVGLEATRFWASVASWIWPQWNKSSMPASVAFLRWVLQWPAHIGEPDPFNPTLTDSPTKLQWIWWFSLGTLNFKYRIIIGLGCAWEELLGTFLLLQFLTQWKAQILPCITFLFWWNSPEGKNCNWH